MTNPKQQNYQVDVEYAVSTTITIQASSIEEAEEKARNITELPHVTDENYIPESFQVMDTRPVKE